MALTSGYKEMIDNLVSLSSSRLGASGLSEVKQDFSVSINSSRRLSYITSFAELVSVLERRGIVGEHCITALYRIGERINCPDLHRQMTRYETYLAAEHHNESIDDDVGRPPVNQYALALMQAPSLYSSGSRSVNNFPQSHYSARNSEPEELRLPDNVVELICCEIGRSWMDLARKLKLREAEIDDIEERKASNSKEKAREVLKIFESRMDHKKWQFVLLNSLVDARRRDVKEGVEELLSRHN